MADYQTIRDETEALAAPLTPEDQMVQSMPDVSPTKWHRAHITWFFETFLLIPHLADYTPFDPAFGFLFNSYYEAVGERHPRHERGLVSRPNAAEVGAYRTFVDEAMCRLISDVVPGRRDLAELVRLGLHHEQQHQELLLMDIKHVFSKNPLRPAYHVRPAAPGPTTPVNWIEFAGGTVPIGHEPSTATEDFADLHSDGLHSDGLHSDGLHSDGFHPDGFHFDSFHFDNFHFDNFHFDNEAPRHDVHVAPFRLADRLVTCGDWLEFMADSGYHEPEHWLSEGWATICREQWDAPMYWEATDNGWHVFTLHGVQRVDPAEPVSHISYYEADAFARWAGARLPTEAEWEHAASVTAADPGPDGANSATVNTADQGHLHPRAAPPADGHPRQLIGDLWEWTSSSYGPYPGFEPAPGAVGEYNGKFMVNQYVLRGGCCATPAGHVRTTYRNFFPTHSRWMFSGVRLATTTRRSEATENS